jgi:hypothetical protein
MPISDRAMVLKFSGLWREAGLEMPRMKPPVRFLSAGGFSIHRVKAQGADNAARNLLGTACYSALLENQISTLNT